VIEEKSLKRSIDLCLEIVDVFGRSRVTLRNRLMVEHDGKRHQRKQRGRGRKRKRK